MKVLVIGGKGNLGSEYCKYLSSQDLTPIAFDVPKDISAIRAEDIEKYSPSFVVNFATVADLKRQHILQSADDYKCNVKGLENLLEVVSDVQIPLIQISTREVIGLRDFRKDPLKVFSGGDDLRRIPEDEPCLPLHSYGKTKLMAEYLCQGYEKGTVIRLNTPYTDNWTSGQGLISVLVKKSCLDGRVRLDNLGRAVRDPLHISDLAELTLKIFEKGIHQIVINAAGGEENIISLKEICIEANPKVVIEDGSENSDFGFIMDIQNAVNLGWRPRTNIRTWLRGITRS
ncbi:MAG: NAD-dependent epimerase/dehydratase family protein [Actinomycetota bacterium]|nr:NAD-dependent epimerase/dehydratase family protein [Actinomycetota bacterium]